MNIFYIYNNNKLIKTFISFEIALKNVLINDEIYVEESNDEIERGIIKVLLYKNGQILVDNIHKYY